MRLKNTLIRMYEVPKYEVKLAVAGDPTAPE